MHFWCIVVLISGRVVVKNQKHKNKKQKLKQMLGGSLYAHNLQDFTSKIKNMLGGQLSIVIIFLG